MPRSSVDAGMSALGLDPALLDGLIARVSRDQAGRPSFDDLMTEGLELTAALIDSVVPEPDTCFIAMPFRDPYPTYYHNIYRILLEGQGFRCVRAWGGLRDEAHQKVLLALIDRCGWLFAELTDASPNVAYELGFATGRKKCTLAVMDTNPDAWKNWRESSQPKVLSNLRGIAVAPYDSSDPAWPADFLNNLGPSYVKVAKEISGKFDAETSSEEVRQRHDGFWSHLFGR